jgi:hypothetical protein
MKVNGKDNVRFKIIDTYSRWTAFSATRSGCPLKSRNDIYPLLAKVDFNSILLTNKEIAKEDFNKWHEDNAIKMHCSRNEMPMGWTTKIINVYLKTMVYVGQFGRPQLINYIHPPIDNGLWDGLKPSYRKDKLIAEKIFSKRLIKDIQTYEEYKVIIGGFELIAEKQGCFLIEVEQFWEGTKLSKESNDIIFE